MSNTNKKNRFDKLVYLNRENAAYVEQLYQDYLANPQSVDDEWRLFFEGVEFSKSIQAGSGFSEKEMRVYELIQNYRDYGYLAADLDPLKMQDRSASVLSLAHHGLKEEDLNKTFQVGAVIGKPQATLKQIMDCLKADYCGTLAVDIAYTTPEVRQWFIREMEESRKSFVLNEEEKKEVFHSITRTESLEKFLQTRFVGAKRFSIEGGDALIPMMEMLVRKGCSIGMEEMVIGMAHRGRVNVLANFMGKAAELIFREFEGISSEDIDGLDGDVKYHLGYTANKPTPQGPVTVTLAFNPSHLEAVDPVVMGMARARQRWRLDTDKRQRVVPVLIHGDAAFIGQGVVSETLQLSQLKGYKVGGTVHIIIDNQVGFTTNPTDSRSSPHCSDNSKSLLAPVIHVNGDDVEACVRAVDLAIRFRQEFKQDVLINLVCYRRFGHNEADEPSFTQPLMYEKIKKHPTLLSIYSEQLIKEGLITQQFADDLFKEKITNLQTMLEHARKNKPKIEYFKFEAFWKGLRRANPGDFEAVVDTRFAVQKLQDIGQAICTVPKDFNIFPKVGKLLEQRLDMINKTQVVDWGMGELLAFASLLSEGTKVRLSGQDAGRGTFSHRHCLWTDYKTGDVYNPLNMVKSDVEFCVYNSPLSEYAVLGFEYGNSISDPTFLTIWEAQFGDFANGAQIIFDQFLSSGETKWCQMSGLVLLLPHGYEGQGPEHSSARLERFLQLCAEDNMQVCNFTTPAQLFHGLRRQIKRDFRKPLIVMSPKSLLRHKKVVSTLEELGNGRFFEVIDDAQVKPNEVKTLVLTSGKLYYDLDEARETQKRNDVALVRIEQLYPFPKSQIEQVLHKYSKVKRVVWAQEEPRNMGAAFFAMPRIQELFKNVFKGDVAFDYVGRTERASPATGSPKAHAKEQEQIVQDCFK